MGFFDRFKKEQSLSEELLNDPVWGGSFVPIDEIYQAFASANLAGDAIISFVANNEEMPLKIGGTDGGQYYVVNDPKHFPGIRFNAEVQQPIYYGDFMATLQQLGEENGWDYLFQLMFEYRSGTWVNDLFDITPFPPIIELDPNDPCCFIISSPRWRNSGGSIHDGMGGAAGL